MSKLKILKSLISRTKEIITLGYQEMEKRKKRIDYEKKIFDDYKIGQLPTIDLLDITSDINETIDCYSFLPGTSLVSDIILLKSLAKRFNECAYLEIGSFRGESISAISAVTPDCTSITLSGDEMRSFNYTEESIKVQGVFSNKLTNIKTYHHNSLNFDFDKLNKKFDLIFVDGDHSYNGVLHDTKNMFKLLKDDKSIIVWHDYGFNEEDVRPEVLAAILDGAPEKHRKNLYHISNTMCAVFINGQFNTTYIKGATYPNKKFSMSVKSERL